MTDTNSSNQNGKATSAAITRMAIATVLIDVAVLQRQLELLGFRPGEVPFIRAFPAKGDPRCNDIKNSRSNNRSRRFDTKEIERWNREGLGLYLTINAGGSKKAEIESCRAIFYEHDNMPKEDQLFLWQALGLPEPTFQTDTGGRSVHSFWVFDKPIAPSQWSWQGDDKQWYGLQADLIAHAGADTALVDLPRVMRLAGGWHVSYDVDRKESYATGQTVIVSQSGKRYSYEELRAVIPERQPVVTIDVGVVDDDAEEEEDNESVSTHTSGTKSTGTKSTTSKKKVKPVETDGTVLDFREVGTQLPYWNESGRNGWATFQCPVHTRDGKPHSTDTIHVNLQTGQWSPKCGCPQKDVYAEVCRLVGFVPPKKAKKYYRRPSFLLLPDGTLYPAAHEDKEKALAYLKIPGKEAIVRAILEGKYIPKCTKSDGADEYEDDEDSVQPKAKKKEEAPPPATLLGDRMSDEHHRYWRYWCEKRTWYKWVDTVWEKWDDEMMRSEIYQLIRIEWGLDPVPSHNYVDNVIKSLKANLIVQKIKSWDQAKFVAFENGILEIETGRLLPHTPESNFTSFLPFQYDALPLSEKSPVEQLAEHCPNIFAFFARAMSNDPKRITKLIATINATITFKFHQLQLFTHIKGRPATGKNTYTRLLEKIVGEENKANTTIRALDEPTELAAIVDKQLVVIPDARKQKENVETILNLTGGTPIRYREVYKPRGESKFYGHLAVVSNSPIFTGDTTGLDRRLSLLQFENPIDRKVRNTNAEALMEPEIPKLIQIALAMPISVVEEYLKGIGEGEIEALRQGAIAEAIESNAMAAWANDNIIIDPEGSVPIGDGKKTPEGEFKTLTAFGSYLDYCVAEGNKYSTSRQTFSRDMQTILADTFGIEGIQYKRTAQAKVLTGIRLRKPDSDHAIGLLEQMCCSETNTNAGIVPVLTDTKPEPSSQPDTNYYAIGENVEVTLGTTKMTGVVIDPTTLSGSVPADSIAVIVPAYNEPLFVLKTQLRKL